MNFCSDNVTPAAEAVIDAVIEANMGPSMPYGNDPTTARAAAAILEAFALAPDAGEVHLLGTGTAANGLALAQVTPPYGAVICHAASHVNTSECGGPELHTGGAKLLGLPGRLGKLLPEEVMAVIDRHADRDPHHSPPRALSLTNATETGQVYTPDEVRRLDGTFWEQVIVPADSQRVREYRERLLRDPESSPGEIEYTIRHKSGGLRTVVERTALFHPTPGSQTPALLALVRDITARKRDEEQLTYQANLLQNVNDAVISVDLNYCVTSWNQAAVEIYGYTPEEALGKPLRDLINTEYPDVGRERAMGQIFSEGTWRGETIQQRKDGTCLRALTSSRLLRDRRGVAR